MADSKITALTAISTVDPTADPLVIVDVSDTSMAASGTTKKSTINQLLGAGGTATLASATISGDLTVDTSTLYVSSSADKVGIGTTSLSNEKLTVAGNISANAWLGRSNISVPAGDCSIFRSADNTLGFGIASTTAMTLNSTGLGIGVTPSAWGGLGSGPGVLQMGNAGCSLLAGGSGFSGTNQFFINNNAYYNATGGSSFKYYRAGGGAAQYSQVGNEHQWKVSSNTPVADTAITFTQAMTLDASGRLILLASTTTPATLATNGELTFTATSNTNLRFSYRGSDGVTRTADLTLA